MNYGLGYWKTLDEVARQGVKRKPVSVLSQEQKIDQNNQNKII
jgi:hypothetical protein